MAIDVVLTGLMLICFDGQTNCPVGGYADYTNTAWVVEADGDKIKPCGWDSVGMTTKLELRFDKGHFHIDYDGYEICGEDPDSKSDMYCDLSGRAHEEVFIRPVPAPAPEDQRREDSLQWLPRIDEVDTRFKAVNGNYLKHNVSNRIHFPTGVIGAGAKWPPEEKPRRWFRSNGKAGGALPRELSDRVKVKFEKATKLEIRNKSNGAAIIVLVPKLGVDTPQVTLRNRGYNLRHYEDGGFDDLTYLLWYYLLGDWFTGSCPDFIKDSKRDVVLLRCVQEHETRRCSWYGNGDADTKYWPPVLRSGY